MPQFFDAKAFNPEVFGAYIDTLPKVRKTELLKSKAIRPRQDLVSSFAAQAGGHYYSSPMKGRISGTKVQNYDGIHDIESNDTDTYVHSRVVCGRSNSWKEADFYTEITGGENFMEDVAAQVNDYFDEVDQDDIIAILKGIFRMTDEAGLEFAAKHTYNVTGKTNANGVLGCVDGTTLNSGMQKALGDQKSKFSLAAMHSTVATNLENINLLHNLKYTDKDGITRDLSLATVNGRLVMIDDSLPVSTTVTQAEVRGVYTITVGTKGVANDTITIGGVTYTLADETDYAARTMAVGASTTTQATALRVLLAEQYDGVFSVTSSGAVVTLTQISGGAGALPTITKTGTIAATAATKTEGKALVQQDVYTTYVLGEGAIEYTDCGAKVPYEMDRDPKVKGGVDLLYVRQRKCWSPWGISFKTNTIISPEADDLANGANWELVSSAPDENGVVKHINPKAIPIARILSLG